MKKSILARGFIGSVASLLGVMAVGCGADTGWEGAAGEGEIDSVEQAIAIAGLNAPSGYAEAKFPAYIAISANEVLVAGGYESDGDAVTTVRIYNKDTGNWDNTVASLNVARGEAQIASIPGTDQFLIVGGRVEEGGAALASAEIYDVSADTMTLVTDTLATPRVNHTLTRCGDKLLVVGGFDTDEPAVENKMEVFTVNGTLANSTFDSLVDNVGATVVTLNTARQFHGAISLSSNTKVLIAGGDNGSTDLSSAEIITVNSSCVVQNDSPNPVAAASMPAARSQFAMAPVSLTISTVDYDALVVAGKNGSALPLETLAYDVNSDVWTSSSPALASGRGRKRPALAIQSVNNFLIAGGDESTSSETSSNKADQFSGSFTTLTMSQKRLGNWAAFIDALYITGHGVDTTTNPDTYLNTPE